jgi:hypothetical protein
LNFFELRTHYRTFDVLCRTAYKKLWALLLSLVYDVGGSSRYKNEFNLAKKKNFNFHARNFWRTS